MGLKKENPTTVDSQHEITVTEKKTSQAITVLTEVACKRFITSGRESAVESRKESKHRLGVYTCVTQTLALPKMLSYLALLMPPFSKKRHTDEYHSKYALKKSCWSHVRCVEVW